MTIDSSGGALMERATSSFPLSIGTALAFESLFDGDLPAYDETRVKPDKISINNYDAIYINLATLHRNILGSVPTATRNTVLPGEVTFVMLDEMQYIANLIEHQTSKKCSVVFYRNRFEKLKEKHPHAKLREPTTALQQLAASDLDKALTHVVSLADQLGKMDIAVHDFRQLPEPVAQNKTNALFITHYAYELLAHKKFDKLDLLESHTGVMKPKSLWYTKFHDGKVLANIPFNSCMLQLFGDQQTFHPMSIAERRAVMSIAERFNWTALTTLDRLRFSFDFLEDKVLASKLKSMLSNS